MVKGENFKFQVMCPYKNCNKMLSCKYNMKRHIDFCHNGLKAHQCYICFKRFSSKQNKLEHVRIEHSYSNDLEDADIRRNPKYNSDINIPSLSRLVMQSLDPDLRPMSKVEKIYACPDKSQRVRLPKIKTVKEKTAILPTMMISWFSQNR
jgi:hypothetical protein